MISRKFVYRVADDSPVSVHNSVFTREEFVLDIDMIRVRLFLIGPQFSAQILVINPYQQLIGTRSVVLHSVIQIVIDDAGARSERYLAVEVGKEVETIVMMVLCDGEF